jgi:hypothetical protein
MDTNGGSSHSADHGVFADSNVAIDRLFEHLAAGGTIDGFLAKYPAVKRSRALGLLESASGAWGGGGPKGYVLEPGPEMLPVYQRMCREFSCEDLDRQLTEQVDDALRKPNGPSITDIIAEIEEKLGQQGVSTTS